MAHRQTRHQLIEAVGGKQAQATTGLAAITGEIHNRAEMGIGVVMPPDGLLRRAHHRPAALDVELHLAEIKSQRNQISPSMLSQGLHQGGKHRPPMQLPNAIDVSRPGATWFRIALGLAPQLHYLLHPLGQLQWIRLQLHPRQCQREKGLKFHARAGHAESQHKKNRPLRAGFSMTCWLAIKPSQRHHPPLQEFPG